MAILIPIGTIVHILEIMTRTLPGLSHWTRLKWSTDFILHNRGDCCQIRLHNFQLEALDANSKNLWKYQDQSTDVLSVYNVTKIQSQPVAILKVKPRQKLPIDASYVATLCELQVFGECVPGTWGLDCSKSCPAQCPTWCQQDTGLCPSCIGYSNPPLCNISVKDPCPKTVAFSVALTQDLSLENDSYVPFDKVYTNAGNGYNGSLSIFTAPVSGLYKFDVAVKSQDALQVRLNLYKNNEYIMSVFSKEANKKIRQQ
uniref:C1q domain-containing protein n=1 Tax=Biomphalaria glabrata TaxID=6526 RepID=A0A2C9M1L1_BIOGL